MDIFNNSPAAARLMPPSFKSFSPLAVIAVAVLLQGCAGAELDPFGRPYSGERTIPPGSRICPSSGLDQEPRMVRGNLPAMPIENSFPARNAAAKVKYRVEASGAVQVLEVDSADKWYGKHAAVAVKDWKMTPAVLNGNPIAVDCVIELGGYFHGFKEEPPGQSNQ